MVAPKVATSSLIYPFNRTAYLSNLYIMATSCASKSLLLAVAVGIFAVAEVVQEQKVSTAPQSGPALILHTVAQELATAVLAGALGFFCLMNLKPSKQAKLKKKAQMKEQNGKPCDADSETSTAEGGDSDGTNGDSDSDCAPRSTIATPTRSPVQSPSVSEKVPQKLLPKSAHSKPAQQFMKPRISRDDIMQSKLSWRQDAAAAQAGAPLGGPAKFAKTPDKTPDKGGQMLPPLQAKAAKAANPTSANAAGMPSTLSSGGCALLQLLRDEQMQKLAKDGNGVAASGPPGL